MSDSAVTEPIVDRLREALESRTEILEAYLFGSVSRGQASQHSDIDVAVFIARDLQNEGPFGYRAELTSVIMSSLAANEVDVVILNRASPLLYHRVLRDGVRILSRDLQATTTREARALSRYCDYLPQLEKIDRATRGEPGAEGADR